ncbi:MULTISPECIES: P-loop NTPase [Caproicibacterium]|jgi:septum site-determining protein MinD|uniref:AAA family ATPase n=2 Tax=Caproicibacterium lactatifermentans TaxID=2666138 RepID=A0ABX6PVV6_9FIRM|nr:P-loop NTPase [Caproicibacterium lactatifermentans]MDD4806953.1 AAA family ATPase [Oscillospiraceae bacterium]QKO30343.1 AAA family ATPase [Caproicibacterium lactatifermentans]
MGAVTVITSGKGGVGKSTTTVHMGLALAARGRRVLLLDCDAGLGCLDMLLGVSQRRVFDLSDVVSGTTSPDKAIYQSPLMPGLFLMPAPLHEEDLVSTGVMRQLVPALAHHYDHVLIDCPAGIGTGFRSACAAADRAVVVSTPDGISTAAAAKVRGQLLTLGISEQRLVINRFSLKFFRRAHFFSDLDAVIDTTGIQLIAVIPEDHALCAAAVNGLPPKNSPAVLAFARLALRLEGHNVPLPPLQKL